MRFSKSFALWIGLLVLNGGLFGQYGLNPSLLNDNILSQQYQPANILEGEFSTFRYGARASGYLGNSDFTMSGIFDEGGYITHETRDRIISQSKGIHTLTGGYQLGYAHVNVKIKGKAWGFYVNENRHLSAQFRNNQTLGLIFKGNGPYQGIIVKDRDIFAKRYHIREIGAGTAWDFAGVKFGARLKIIQGIQMMDLRVDSYSLFTGEDGGSLDLQADYDLISSREMGNSLRFRGFGIGTDLGVRMPISDKVEIGISAIDVGATFWKANQRKHSVDIQGFEGISINSLFMDSIPEAIEDQVDSLSGLILGDSVGLSHVLATPATIRGTVRIQLTEKDLLAGTLLYSPVKNGPFTQLPLLHFAYRRTLVADLNLTASLYAGGTDQFGFGLMADYNFNPFGNMKFNLVAGSDNLLGFIAPSFGRGMSAYAGIGVSL